MSGAIMDGRKDLEDYTKVPRSNLEIKPFPKTKSFEEFVKENYDFGDSTAFNGSDIIHAFTRYVDEVIRPTDVKAVTSMCVFKDDVFMATDRGVFKYDSKLGMIVPVDFMDYK